MESYGCTVQDKCRSPRAGLGKCRPQLGVGKLDPGRGVGKCGPHMGGVDKILNYSENANSNEFPGKIRNCNFQKRDMISVLYARETFPPQIPYLIH